jgi:hypothetical protein
MSLLTDQTQRAIALVERLPPEQLVKALNFLEQLSPTVVDRRADPEESDLSAMANDPEIQAEIAAIGQEFAGAEMDGLSIEAWLQWMLRLTIKCSF